MFVQGLINPFWKDEFKNLNYVRRPHNNSLQIDQWIDQGFSQKNFTGKMYGMDSDMPSWCNPFFNLFPSNYIGLCLYKMETGDIMPRHSDTFEKFKKIHNLSSTSDIHRAIIFLEDWKRGHIFEIENTLLSNWKSGDYVIWKNNTPHMAANLGLEPRYTAQITFVPLKNLL